MKREQETEKILTELVESREQLHELYLLGRLDRAKEVANQVDQGSYLPTIVNSITVLRSPHVET